MIPPRKDIHTALFLFGLALLLVGLPLSRFLLSISYFILAGNWLLEAGFREKFSRLRSSPVLIMLLSFFLFNLLSYFWSENSQEWYHDARVKFPLFLLTFLIGTTTPLSLHRWKQLILLFTAALFIKSFIGLGICFQWWGKPITDIREITGSLSHIRFSLMLCLDLILLYFLFFRGADLRTKLITACCWLWMLGMLLLLKNLTGIMVLGVTGSFLFALYLFRSGRNKITLGIGAVFLFLLCFAGYRAWDVYTRFFVPKTEIVNTEARSSLGNPYSFDTEINMLENGYRVGNYLAWGEMSDAWNSRSSISIPNKDRRGNEITFTLLRFLTSKGWRKDAEAVKKLSDSEVEAIENGIANTVYISEGPLTSRLHQVIWELEEYFYRGADPSGHSVTQRFEFWKATIHCWKNNVWIGVGTGDLNGCLQRSYQEIGSRLQKENRLRPHNQYLSIGAGMGIAGLLLFFVTLFLPFLYREHRKILYFTFLLIMCLSMLTEDTLETQTGVTLFAAFNSLLLFHFPSEKRS